MNNSARHFMRFRHLAPVFAIALLVIQIALLWLQGALLNRQYSEITSLRSDVQNLTVALHEIMATDELEPFSFEKMKQSETPGAERAERIGRIKRIEPSTPEFTCKHGRTEACRRTLPAVERVSRAKPDIEQFRFERLESSTPGFTCKSCIDYLEK